MVRVFMVLFFISLINKNFAQTTVNPDISLIGTFNTFTNFIKNSPEYGKLNFDTPSMELFVDGYLNPYARATGNIAYEEEEFAVEELYANIVRGLPLDMQIKAGKYLLGFGKINTAHPHAWQFLERPLFHQVFFGPEGLNDIGLDVNFLLPTGDLYTNLDLGIYKGNYFPDFSDSNYINRGVNPYFVGRLGSFLPIGDFGNLELGLSSSYGTYSKVDFSSTTKNLNYLYAGIDFKYKYSPSMYTALIIQGEGLMDWRNAYRRSSSIEEINKIHNGGAFIFIDYKFYKIFSLGTKYDYTTGIVDDEPGFYTLNNDDKNSTQGVELWFSYYPVEETTVLRLGVQHLIFNYSDGTTRDGETTLRLQFIFSLGPHKAHPF